MSRVYQIHVDTSSTNNSQTNIPGGTNSMVTPNRVTYPNVVKQSNNPFNCTVILGQTHRRLRKVSLKSAEMPIAFTNVRAPYNVITIGGTTYTIPAGNYNIGTLITALNTTITVAVGSFAYNSATATITFTSAVGSVSLSTNVSGRSLPNLLYFMGFVNGQTGSVITGTNSYMINFDTYISVYIPNLRNSSQEPSFITFKIPVNVASGGIQYYAERAQFSQELEIYDRSIMFDRLDIQVRDRFGELLNNAGIDWSFTIEIESDT
jgi:hypothetical protein